MKVLILSSARTGSNYLRNLLYQYSPPGTLLMSEPFLYKIAAFKNQDKHVRKVIKECTKSKNVVLKTHLNHFQYIHNPKYLDQFLNAIQWYRVLLLRKDLFSCTFSHAVADTINNFGVTRYTESTFEVDEDRFINTMQYKITFWKEFLELKKQNKYDKIVYFEDLTFDVDTDYKNLNIPLERERQRTMILRDKTPYNMLHVTNKDKLKEMFDKEMQSFSHPGIKNSNGFLELE